MGMGQVPAEKLLFAEEELESIEELNNKGWALDCLVQRCGAIKHWRWPVVGIRGRAEWYGHHPSK